MERYQAPGGLFGPGADAESRVLEFINRQDRYIARRTCRARRRELGALTTTLVLSEEDTDAGRELLESMDLAASFPALRRLVLRSDNFDDCAWPERFKAFIRRNLLALAQLQHLDLGDRDGKQEAAVDDGLLATLVQLSSLRSLACRCPGDWLKPPSWSALASLKQLTSLRLCVYEKAGQHLRHIVEAAPQLQALYLFKSLRCRDYYHEPVHLITSLTRLQSLGSLELRLEPCEIMKLPQLGALQSLTRLQLSTARTTIAVQEWLTGELVAAVGQLTSLASLALRPETCCRPQPLAPLAALQQLTSLDISRAFHLDEQGARVLAGLGGLRRLDADFSCAAAAAAAGLDRLEQCCVSAPWDGGPVARINRVDVVGRVELSGELRLWDYSRATALTVRPRACRHVQILAEQLQDCQQLQALCCWWQDSEPRAKLLRAIATLPQLQHLRLHTFRGARLDCGALAAGCRQLRQLTLEGVQPLQESALVALMSGLPRLRLLRLLRCSPALTQERCQALVGRLGLWALQVDVVMDDRSGRARWMIEQLQERWAEA
jgi:hypothetical protein